MNFIHYRLRIDAETKPEVSVLNLVSPRLTSMNLFLVARNTSSLVKSPSGPIKIHRLLFDFNVCFVFCHYQKLAFVIVECDPELKAKSAKTAMLFSRTNTLLSIPMLLTMVSAQNLY